MKKDNGGTAFPIAAGPGQQFTQGMSLRDWFAGQAMAMHPGIDLTHSDSDDVDTDFSGAVRRCYQYADAMLAERNKERVE